MMNIVERTEAHYDVQEVEFGRVYKWCPERIVVDCACGQRLVLTSSATTCDRCGADHAASLREEPAARRLGDEALHPWRYEDRGDAGIPF